MQVALAFNPQIVLVAVRDFVKVYEENPGAFTRTVRHVGWWDLVITGPCLHDLVVVATVATLF